MSTRTLDRLFWVLFTIMGLCNIVVFIIGVWFM